MYQLPLTTLQPYILCKRLGTNFTGKPEGSDFYVHPALCLLQCFDSAALQHQQCNTRLRQPAKEVCFECYNSLDFQTL